MCVLANSTETCIGWFGAFAQRWAEGQRVIQWLSTVLCKHTYHLPEEAGLNSIPVSVFGSFPGHKHWTNQSK